MPAASSRHSTTSLNLSPYPKKSRGLFSKSPRLIAHNSVRKAPWIQSATRQQMDSPRIPMKSTIGTATASTRNSPGYQRFVTADKVSSVQYTKFGLTDAQAKALGQEGTIIRAIVTHPHYQAQAVLGENVRCAIQDYPR